MPGSCIYFSWRFLGINNIMAIGVDYPGVFIPGSPEIGQIVEVDMAVDEVFGLENPHEPQKNLESPVAGVLLVVDVPGRGMGQEYVQKAPPEDPVDDQGGDELEHFQKHLEFGVLVIPPVIHSGAPQTGDDAALLKPHPGADMDGARSLGDILLPGGTEGVVAMKFVEVMVPKDEEEGFVKAGNDEFQVFQGKIPGAEDQIDILKPFFYGSGIDQGINIIGNTEYFHAPVPPPFRRHGPERSGPPRLKRIKAGGEFCRKYIQRML
jgi:hypothetical protein